MVALLDTISHLPCLLLSFGASITRDTSCPCGTSGGHITNLWLMVSGSVFALKGTDISVASLLAFCCCGSASQVCRVCYVKDILVTQCLYWLLV